VDSRFHIPPRVQGATTCRCSLRHLPRTSQRSPTVARGPGSDGRPRSAPWSSTTGPAMLANSRKSRGTSSFCTKTTDHAPTYCPVRIRGEIDLVAVPRSTPGDWRVRQNKLEGHCQRSRSDVDAKSKQPWRRLMPVRISGPVVHAPFKHKRFDGGITSCGESRAACRVKKRKRKIRRTRGLSAGREAVSPAGSDYKRFLSFISVRLQPTRSIARMGHRSTP